MSLAPRLITASFRLIQSEFRDNLTAIQHNRAMCALFAVRSGIEKHPMFLFEGFYVFLFLSVRSTCTCTASVGRLPLIIAVRRGSVEFPRRAFFSCQKSGLQLPHCSSMCLLRVQSMTVKVRPIFSLFLSIVAVIKRLVMSACCSCGGSN